MLGMRDAVKKGEKAHREPSCPLSNLDYTSYREPIRRGEERHPIAIKTILSFNRSADVHEILLNIRK